MVVPAAEVENVLTRQGSRVKLAESFSCHVVQLLSCAGGKALQTGLRGKFARDVTATPPPAFPGPPGPRAHNICSGFLPWLGLNWFRAI